MGTFGSISAMISSLKNNKLPKRDHKLGHLEYTKGISIGKPLCFKNKLSEMERLAYMKALKNQRLHTDLLIAEICLVLFGLIALVFF